jgi:transmembrane sensor
MGPPSRTIGQGDPALSMAVEWMVLLHSGQVGHKERACFDAWCAQNPAHQAACDRIAKALGAFGVLRERRVSSTLVEKTVQSLSRRSVTRATLSVVGLGAGMGAGLLGWQVANQQGLLADQSTGLAQRHQEALPDGSTLWLDARTAVDMAFATGQRTLTLHQGRLLVQAPAAGPRGPLRVQTAQGQVAAGQARFVVQRRRDARLLQVTALAGRVEVVSTTGQSAEVPAGHHATLAPGRAPIVTAARGSEDLWTRGLVAMANQPLGELVEALRDYRTGMLRVEPRAAQIPISGIFSLDDTEATLRALAETQPVRISKRTSYWVTVEAA